MPYIILCCLFDPIYQIISAVRLETVFLLHLDQWFPNHNGNSKIFVNEYN